METVMEWELGIGLVEPFLKETLAWIQRRWKNLTGRSESSSLSCLVFSQDFLLFGLWNLLARLTFTTPTRGPFDTRRRLATDVRPPLLNPVIDFHTLYWINVEIKKTTTWNLMAWSVRTGIPLKQMGIIYDGGPRARYFMRSALPDHLSPVLNDGRASSRVCDIIRLAFVVRTDRKSTGFPWKVKSYLPQLRVASVGDSPALSIHLRRHLLVFHISKRTYLCAKVFERVVIGMWWSGKNA